MPSIVNAARIEPIQWQNVIKKIPSDIFHIFPIVFDKYAS